MKIVKLGKKKSNEIEKICGYCDTTFNYEPSDINYDRDGNYVICPLCSHFIDVGDSHQSEDRSRFC